MNECGVSAAALSLVYSRLPGDDRKCRLGEYRVYRIRGSCRLLTVCAVTETLRAIVRFGHLYVGTG
jgi:hypothetical protein